ncbi:uncharacterized protein BXZ73DRAFT_51631 [Epithele typhae]|uniref:uncharacterized protein n=1 Tax=Epithele typhae TaxID=378194 RepID=UPI002008976C|nr:uncharacterized protein BXZ73DRAFT_51631 [Epithele typhae]KAH9921684.1 hypothetical protein BXZ73DRAFT_51631 [Epithele typhae]
MLTKMSSRSPDGAVYFLNNDPDDVMIITASIDRSGSLRLDRAVAAGGRGLHGNSTNGMMGNDPLFSQGAIDVSIKKNVLGNVNPGSNTVSLFHIDPRKPTNITPIGYPVSSEGEFPISVAFNSDGSRLCVLNGGAVDGVHCYTVDTQKGLLPLPNTLRPIGINQTTPAFAGATLSHVLFSADDRTLFASYKGLDASRPGFVAAWAVAADGALSARYRTIPLPNGGVVGFGMATVRGRDALVVTDPGVGVHVLDLSGANRSSLVAPPGETASCWAAYSELTGSYYATDAGAAVVHEIAVDGDLNAKVIGNFNLTAMAGPLDSQTAVVRNKAYLYVLAPGAGAVEVLALEGVGKAKLMRSVDIIGTAQAAGLTIQKFNLQGMATYYTAAN